LTLTKYKDEVTFNNLDELIESIFEEYHKKLELTKGNKKITIKLDKDILYIFGIEENTMICADERTMDIITKYDFLQNATHLINNKVWFDSVILLNKLKPRLF
jgi:hypothetical protein